MTTSYAKFPKAPSEEEIIVAGLRKAANSLKLDDGLGWEFTLSYKDYTAEELLKAIADGTAGRLLALESLTETATFMRDVSSIEEAVVEYEEAFFLAAPRSAGTYRVGLVTNVVYKGV